MSGDRSQEGERRKPGDKKYFLIIFLTANKPTFSGCKRKPAMGQLHSLKSSSLVFLICYKYDKMKA